MKKDRKLERKAISAVTKTLRTYEKLFENFRENIKFWEGYGLPNFCLVCEAMTVPDYLYDSYILCEECPLNSCAGVTFSEFKKAIHDYFDGTTPCETTVKKAARKRYNYLIKTLNKNGYEYV